MLYHPLNRTSSPNKKLKNSVRNEKKKTFSALRTKRKRIKRGRNLFEVVKSFPSSHLQFFFASVSRTTCGCDISVDIYTHV